MQLISQLNIHRFAVQASPWSAYRSTSLSKWTRMEESKTSLQTCAIIAWRCMWGEILPNDLLVPSFSSHKSSVKSLKWSTRSGAPSKSWSTCRRLGAAWARHRRGDIKRCLKLIVVDLISRGRWPRMASDLIRSALVTRTSKLPTIESASIRKKESSRTISLNMKHRKTEMLPNRRLSRSKPMITSRCKTRVEATPRTNPTTLTT